MTRTFVHRPGRSIVVVALTVVSAVAVGSCGHAVAPAGPESTKAATTTIRSTAPRSGTALSAMPAPRSYATGFGGPSTIKATPSSSGFYLVTGDGTVAAFGDAPFLGSARLPHPVATLAVTKTGRGYWVFDVNGCVQAFGDAKPFSQSICDIPLNGDVLDAAVTPDGGGYWLVASDGGVFAFGDAPFLGSMGGKPLNEPVVGMAARTDGGGYWEVASDGGIFSFNAPFLGSMGSTRLNQPVVGMVASGPGYMMVGADGGIFNFGNPFYGSLGASPPEARVVSTAPSLDAAGQPNGYWMLDVSGIVYGFGSAWLPTGPPPSNVAVDLYQGTDPETSHAGIYAVYRWGSGFDPAAGVVVSLYQDGTLVGRVPFAPGWDHAAPAFFRTSPSGHPASIYATGALRLNGADIPGSLAQSPTQQWPITVDPGQVVNYG